jgi:hypothetical protein
LVVVVISLVAPEAVLAQQQKRDACAVVRQEEAGKREQEAAKAREAERAVEYYREFADRAQQELGACMRRPGPGTTGPEERPPTPRPITEALPGSPGDAARITELRQDNDRLRAQLATGGGEPARRLSAIKRQLEPDVAKVAERLRTELPCSDIQIGVTDDVTGFLRGTVRSTADVEKATQAVRESLIGRFFSKHDLIVGGSVDRCAVAVTPEWALRRTQNGEIAVVEDKEIDPGDREHLPDVQVCSRVGAMLDASDVFREWNKKVNQSLDVLLWVRSGKALRQCWRRDGQWQSSATDTGGWSGLVLMRIN